MQYPTQIKTIHAEVLDGELCIYDWQRSKVHNLNPTAALVWQMCDGQTDPEQMTGRLQAELGPITHAEELVWFSLKELQKARLISMPGQRPVAPAQAVGPNQGFGPDKGLSRRQLLKGLGVTAALLPVVSSIVAPGPVDAQSSCTTTTTTTTYSAGVPKTGQTTLYETGDDGDLQKGVTWPSPRFTDNGDGTVTDNMTTLIWLKNADFVGVTRTWATALTDANTLADGSGGLSDGSSAGDWRLPNVRELSSLTDFSQSSPSLPSGYPFTSVQTSGYWSSTTYAQSTSSAWLVNMYGGLVRGLNKTDSRYVWPVRGGQ